MKSMTALGTGTVSMPADLRPMTVWGGRIGDEWTVETDQGPMICRISAWSGIRFIEERRIKAGRLVCRAAEAL